MPQLLLNPHPPDDTLCEHLKQPVLLNACSTPKWEGAALNPKGSGESSWGDPMLHNQQLLRGSISGCRTGAQVVAKSELGGF